MNATLERTEIEEVEEEAAIKAPTLAAGSSLDPTDIFTLKDVSVSYDGVPAVAGVNLTIPAGKVTALIGPSGCGKSTLLRCFNRMNDELGNVEVGGSFTLDGEEINDRKVDPVALRMKVGQVFQRPNPFPMSIYDNVAYGPRLQGIRSKSLLNPIVERSLKAAALWTEVKDSLKKHAFELSGGQQQRLCIARALATEPEVILMDEPCASLDPISTKQIEDTVISLKGRTTIIIVTHSMTQARRVSDQCIYMLRESMEQPARVIEVGETEQVFTDPHDERTAAYINGHFG